MNLTVREAFLSIATVNIDVLTEFYCRLFDIEPIKTIPGKYSELQINSLKIALFKPKIEHLHQFEHPHQSPFNLCVTVADLDIAIAHVSDLGYPPSTDINIASHGREIYLYDPDGNRIILYQPSTIPSP